MLYSFLSEKTIRREDHANAYIQAVPKCLCVYERKCVAYVCMPGDADQKSTLRWTVECSKTILSCNDQEHLPDFFLWETN